MKILTLLMTLFLGLSSALEIAVSIVPQKVFVEKIGSERVKVSLMVPPGSSPHHYEPKASQMKALSDAALYFSVGVEFEEAWLGRFESTNPSMRIVDSTAGIEKRHAHHADHHGDDPHVWLEPDNVAIMARNIHMALVAEDPEGKAYYDANLKLFLDEIAQTDAKIRAILKKLKPGSVFMTFHPSWGYFAKKYGLKQLAVEVEGKEPKARALIALMKQARSAGVKAIVAQPEFSDASSQVLAKELGIEVIKLSPLHPDWSQTLLKLAHAIAR